MTESIAATAVSSAASKCSVLSVSQFSIYSVIYASSTYLLSLLLQQLPSQQKPLQYDPYPEDPPVTSTFDPIRFSNQPAVYWSLVAPWSILLIAWLAHIVLYRRYKFQLHRWLVLVPIAKIITLITGAIFASDCLRKGVKGESSSCMGVSYFVFQGAEIVFYVSVFLSLFLIAKGLSITRRRLGAQETKSIIWFISVLIGCMIAALISELFFFPLMLLQIFIFLNIFTSLVMNMRGLFGYSQYYYYRFLNDPSVDQRTIAHKNPAILKMNMLRRSYLIITMYLLSVFMLGLGASIIGVGTSYSPSSAWITVLTDQLVQCVVTAALGFTLRLRDFSEYSRYNLITYHDIESQEIEIVIDDFGHGQDQYPQEPYYLNLAPPPKASGDSSYPSDYVVVVYNPYLNDPSLQGVFDDRRRAVQRYTFIALLPDEPPEV